MNEVRDNLARFVIEWKDAAFERQHAQGFWREFFACFGIGGASSVLYEKKVTKLGGAAGYIDSFIPGKLIVEAKSGGKNLSGAFDQASDYFLALSEAERPRYILVSDFQTWQLTDLSKDISWDIALDDLPTKAHLFRFLFDDHEVEVAEERVADRAAAYKVSKLHKVLLDNGLTGINLDVFLTRLLFCFFADDTGLFPNGDFHRLIKKTPAAKLGATLAQLFQTLNKEERPESLDEDLARFPYVNGSLFRENLDIPSFDRQSYKLVLETSSLDWSGISPAIFGAMFQGILEGEFRREGDEPVSRTATRREMGAHYTSERNILKVIKPLFIDELRQEFEASRNDKARMRKLYERLPNVTFLDPACGCGSFLVIAYRELRRLEMDILDHILEGKDRSAVDIADWVKVNVHQMHGIELDVSASEIAKVALWITDHQMSMEAARRFGSARRSLPLRVAPTIKTANALRVSWEEVLPASYCDYVIGNPPFVGKKRRTKEQNSDLELVIGKNKSALIPSAGVLDYVCAWFIKAAQYVQGSVDTRAELDIFLEDATAWGGADSENFLALDEAWKNWEPTKVGFVATNSITQGEQAGLLWGWMFAQGIEISFAHRTFSWTNEGMGNAGVSVVIVGFGKGTPEKRTLFSYVNAAGEPTAQNVDNINGYLEDAQNTVIVNRSKPLSAVPPLVFGNMANDDGNLLLTTDERDALVAVEPGAEKWIRQFIQADEVLYGTERWCLWLKDIEPYELESLPHVKKRVQAVETYRKKSKREATKKLALVPHRFAEIRQPDDGNFLVVPRHTSEKREFIPIGYFGSETVCGDANTMVPNATLFHFGVLNSTLHNSWMRTVAGRLESRYRYSNTLVYNNFPWVGLDEDVTAIEAASQSILNARAAHRKSNLAELYEPTLMPEDLRKAHRELDKAVYALYGYTGSDDELSRVRFLFSLYEEATS